MRITITVPDDHAEEVCQAIADTYVVPADKGGLKQHLVGHLKTTVQERRRAKAAIDAVPDFGDGSWGDLKSTD